MKRKRHAGFTLIELVIVIAILAILAAFALPRFVNLTTQARVATLQGVAGALNSAAAMAHGACLSLSSATPPSSCTDTTPSVVMEGATVNLVHEYPDGTVNGIGAAITNSFAQANSSITATYGGTPTAQAVFQVTGTTGTNCEVTYTPPAAAGASPVVAVNTTGC